MTFTSGAKITADIINDVANGLIAQITGYWTDADTTWNTTTKTGNSARRALKYSDGIETIYLALEAINQASGINYYSGGGAWYYGKGIRIFFSTAWDSTGHTYSGTIQSTIVPFEAQLGTVSADLATMMVTYFMWYESNGFVIIGKPEPTGDNNQQSFIIVVERNPNKRYVDTYSTFYCYTALNIWTTCLYDGYWQADTKARNRTILRPFAYQFPDYTGSGQVGSYNANGNGLSFSPLPSYYAYKSAGNGKVYYIKPIVHNQANAITPIFQSELFFMWSENVGIIDGDIVAIQGQITKFLCKALDSPDNTNRLTYAIKYLG